MSVRQNTNGRAYEYACINAIKEAISYAIIDENEAYKTSKKAFNSLSADEKQTYKISANAMVPYLLQAEPKIMQDNELFLQIQADAQGIAGDVRDILLQKPNIAWIIGLSVKHNHFPLKHSRLSQTLDFGASWYGVSVGDEYKSQIAPIFALLQSHKGKPWQDVNIDKNASTYRPLLQAFMSEVLRANSIDKKLPQKIVEYLLGRYDFYKVISVENQRLTQLQGFNLYGSLNQKGKIKPKIIVPKAKMPSRLIHLDFKPNSHNTLELILDEGWQFSLRIHNASSKIENSLKFDVKLISYPASIIKIDCIWG